MEKTIEVHFHPFIDDLGLGVSDHNGAFVPYFAADEAVTMDSLWRGEESVVQGKHVLAMFSALLNSPTVANLTEWKSNGKSLIAQKLVHVIAASDVLISIPVAAMQKSSGVLMMTS